MATISPASAERIEAETFYLIAAAAPAPVRAARGIGVTRLGGGVAAAMRDDPTGFWNHASGFGFAEPITAQLVEEICEFYRSARAPRANLQLATPATGAPSPR